MGLRDAFEAAIAPTVPTEAASDYLREIGRKGGAKGGGKWWASLTDEQRKTHQERMQAGRKRKKEEA